MGSFPILRLPKSKLIEVAEEGVTSSSFMNLPSWIAVTLLAVLVLSNVHLMVFLRVHVLLLL